MEVQSSTLLGSHRVQTLVTLTASRGMGELRSPFSHRVPDSLLSFLVIQGITSAVPADSQGSPPLLSSPLHPKDAHAAKTTCWELTPAVCPD